MIANRLHGMFAAVVGLFSKPTRSAKRTMSESEMRAWLNSQPDIAEEARRGFEAIDAGHFRRVSRRGNT